jgi:hypothetical protein
MDLGTLHKASQPRELSIQSSSDIPISHIEPGESLTLSRERSAGNPHGCGLAMAHVLAGGNPVCVAANHRRSI